MSLLFKTPTSPDSEFYPPIPDPWTLSYGGDSQLPIWPRPVPLDPTHELVGMPIPEVLMPEGLPGALQLSAPISGQSAIAILLSDELRLGTPVDELLGHQIQDAIALLTLADSA